MLALLHRRGLTEIAATCKRRKEIIKLRQNQGAPIAVDEARYCAEYNASMYWLIHHNRTNPVKPS